MQTKIFLGALGLALSLNAPQAEAQSPPHTYIPRALLDELAKTDGDHPARMVDIAKKYNLGAYLLHLSPRKAQTQNGWAHHDISELYYVIRGSGTFLIGGQILNPKEDDPNTESVKTVRGPSMTGELKGYLMQKYSAGDVIIIPVDVPHLPTYEITETVDMLRVVIDPQRAIRLK
jgi:mannose-6-phosphate isomerase-like protein (cupin superfamily)